jgi:hypothetical protein
MAAPRLLPPANELLRMVEAGMTHQQIADRIQHTTGVPVSRSTVSAALSRAGLASVGHRYKRELPWKVKAEHLTQYPARMLRLLGRRRSGVELTEEEYERLEAWMVALEDKNLVVGYAPEGNGFIYVVADEKNDGEGDIPIRKRVITPEEIEG